MADEIFRDMRRTMGLGQLRLALFNGGKASPAVLETATQTSDLFPELVKLLTQVHLAVCWAAEDVAFPHIRLQPIFEDENAVRVIVTIKKDDPLLPWLRQFFDELVDPPATYRSSGDDEAGGSLAFTLTGAMVRKIRGYGPQ